MKLAYLMLFNQLFFIIALLYLSQQVLFYGLACLTVTAQGFEPGIIFFLFYINFF
jgi:hypothetical protein